MKLFQALQKAMRYLLMMFVPGIRALTSAHMPSGNSQNDPDSEYEDDELEGWTRVYQDPFFSCEDNGDIEGRGPISLVE